MSRASKLILLTAALVAIVADGGCTRKTETEDNLPPASSEPATPTPVPVVDINAASLPATASVPTAASVPGAASLPSDVSIPAPAPSPVVTASPSAH